MPAAASATRRWGRGCCRWTTSSEAHGRSPPSSTSSIANASASNSRRVEEATRVAEAEIGGGEGPPVLVLASAAWHAGIVGLVAARLRERFERPAFAIALGPDGGGTGSGRSVPGGRSRPRRDRRGGAGAVGPGRGACDGGRRNAEARRLGPFRAHLVECSATVVRGPRRQRRSENRCGASPRAARHPISSPSRARRAVRRRQSQSGVRLSGASGEIPRDRRRRAGTSGSPLPRRMARASRPSPSVRPPPRLAKRCSVPVTTPVDSPGGNAHAGPLPGPGRGAVPRPRCRLAAGVVSRATPPQLPLAYRFAKAKVALAINGMRPQGP